MPKVIKKRPEKKKPVQDDEVKSAALQAVEKVKERQQQIIIGVSALVILIVLIVIYSTYTSTKSSEAYAIEQEAYTFYYGSAGDASMSQEDKLKKALELFKESVDLKATPTARFYIGNSYHKLGDYENAITEYEAFASEFSRAKGVLPIVLQKLAATYFKVEKNEKAFETLDRLANAEGGIFKDTALVMKARHLDGAEQADKALEIYRELSMEFPNSPWIGEAESKIQADEAKKAEAAKEDAEGTSEVTGEAKAPEAAMEKDQPAEAPAE